MIAVEQMQAVLGVSDDKMKAALAARRTVECPTCQGTMHVPHPKPPEFIHCSDCTNGTVHPLIDWLVADQSGLLVDALKRGGVL